MNTTSTDHIPNADAHRPWRLPAFVKRFDLLPFILIHMACLAVFITGVSSLALVLCGVCYAVRVFAITAGYHRYFSHRSYKASRAFQFVLACLGCSACQKGPLWWVGHHRYHHLHSDQSSDLHSPHTSSFWRSHVGWIISRDHDETNWKLVQDWNRYPELRWLNRFHWVPGLALALACLLIGGGVGLVWGFFVSTVLVYHATFTINSLSHLFGRRRYATEDKSRNNLFLALITFGEGWHNNHHRYQSSANQGFFWWEIDLSYYVIVLLGVVGLVWDIRNPPRAVLEEATNPLLSAHRPGLSSVNQIRTEGEPCSIFPRSLHSTWTRPA
jgi:stearoyl-CoA desaturase (delta-9 desaturase)